MDTIQRKLVHKQFNSPMGLYSQENIKETLNRELKAFGNEGLEIDEHISRPLNLASSEVLRAVEEEDQMKCEPSVKCERQSRSRHRFFQPPHTPVHQHQLEQIKTQYLSHQHDITIDRDTVLKINRLTTRRNLHKREHSWPPTIVGNPVTTNTTPTPTTTSSSHEHEQNGQIVRQEQHIRSTSIDNALQFDETVCKRRGIDEIRKKFNSPTRIIEPSAQEVRQRRAQQRRLQQQKVQEKHSKIKSDGSGVDSCEAEQSFTTNKPKQMINLVKHKELLRKISAHKSATMTDIQTGQEVNEKTTLKGNIRIAGQPSAIISSPIECDKSCGVKKEVQDELCKTITSSIAKGISHPETKAADTDIGLVEPKKQFYEHLTSSKKWHSQENLNAVADIKPTNRPLPLQTYKRQAHSLERGREARQHKQLPPQKPRCSPKLQRRSMKLATEIKISYDTDAQQHNIQVKSLNQPKVINPTPTPTASQDDLEHIPLPATPHNFRKMPSNVEQSNKQEIERKLNDDAKIKSFKEQQIYDDSCIFLRSVDLQDNTVAYIPAAITIVPSPTEDLMEHWLESSNLRADIKGVKDIQITKATTTKTSNDLQYNEVNSKPQLTHTSVKSVAKPEGIKHQQSKKQHEQQQQNDKQHANEMKTATATYITRLPSTPTDIQPTRQASATTKSKTQMSNNNDNSTLVLTTKTATHESPQPTRPPGVKYSNSISTEYKKLAKKGDKTQQQGVYYTDGEYVYGPYDSHNGTPLANATIRSLQADQQEKNQHLHQQAEIKKDIEAETKSQHKNEIANLTAKYDNIQKSINEHLRQIDAYIENAKAALKSTIPLASCQHRPTQPHHNHPQCNLKVHLQQQQYEKTETETPLKEILRKITDIMQEVKPLYRNQKAKPEICMQQTSTATQQDEEENMPIVDKVLMDLNMLTKHLSEFDMNSSEELKPIMEQLDLQFEIRPSATTGSHVLINEAATDKQSLRETGKTHQKSSPSTPPPLPLPTTTPVPMTTQEKGIQNIADKQLLATDKLITTQTQNQQHTQQQRTMSAAGPKDKDKNKNFVFDVITARHKQEQLVEQVVDTLGMLKIKSNENLVNIHVPAHDDDDNDEKAKSNLSQQKTLTTEMTTSTNDKKKDVIKLQNSNISTSPNAFGEHNCNHHDNVPKSTKDNEIQLKLHIQEFADKNPDKQFQKYDGPPASNKVNDVVDKNSPFEGDNEDKDKNIKTEEESGSNHSSGSELSNTYKSSYELPSPYVTMHQISWEDVLSSAMKQTLANSSNTQQENEKDAATIAPITNPKHVTEIAQICNKSPVTLDKTEPMEPVVTSGHVGMQSMTKSKSRIQTRQQQSQQELQQTLQIQYHHNQQHREQAPDEGRKYPASLIEPHLPTRSTSPFGLYAVEMLFQRRSSSLSPTRLRVMGIPEDIIATAVGRQELMQAIKKHPSPLAEPHLPKRAKSPFGLSAPSISPKRCENTLQASPRTLDEVRIRKYPAPLAEPHVTTRAASPFGLNAVDDFHIARATTPLPAYGEEVKNDNEQEQECNDKHEDKPTSPIRKYPPSLVEPHVPTRAASPFGLNAVDTTQKARHRTPSPHKTASLKSTSTSSDCGKKAVVYVPQVEGHNIGLVVRTNTPTPHCHTDITHASSIHKIESGEMINVINTPHNYATTTTRGITDDNAYCAANTNGRVAYCDDDAAYDELQHINAIGLTKQGTAATTNKTLAHHLHQQHQLLKQEQQQQCAEHHLQNQEHYSGTSGQHMTVDTISLPIPVINRSFDNVSPRPYISMEGYKRVAWPPTSEERIVREFTPQPQTQPAPAYNQQQQQHQPSVAPPTQGPIYNNIQHNTNNNLARETNSPYKQNPRQNDCEAFPPQTPETPIILKDKQFSRLPSQEPNQTDTVPYQQYQQPQNISMQQQLQQHHHQEQPLCKQPLYNQQNYPCQQQPHEMQEEHHQYHLPGWKPIRPPQTKQEHMFTSPTAAPPFLQQQYQNYHPPSTNQQQQYRAPSFDNYQQPPPQQYPAQPQYQAQAPHASQNLYQQPPQAGQPAQQSARGQQQSNEQQQQYQKPPWVQPQQPQLYQQQQQPQYQNPLNQYNQAPHHHQQQQQQQQQYPIQQNQFLPQTNQQQFNSYSQHQQQQHTVSHDQVDQQQPHLPPDQRGTSPGIITLRKEAPITQKPAPIYTSQPAAISFRGGSNMRGDLKWPPPEYKEAAAKENEERRKLALGPVCRPRKVNRDYTSFFAKNALSHHYPSYKVPPGTQHMIN